MRRETASALFALALIPERAAAVRSSGVEAGTHVSWSAESCLRCHAASDSAELAERTTRPCRALCATCHDFREGHHPVGVTISRSVPAPLLLTKGETNTCVTCHDVTRPRLDGSPWVSQSLFERTIRRSRENRTFYLVMRNDRGQLCRSCH